MAVDVGILTSGLLAMEQAGGSVFDSMMPSVMELFKLIKMTAWAIVIGVLLLQQRFLHPALVKALALFVVIGWLIQIFPQASDAIIKAMSQAGTIAAPNLGINIADPGYIAFFGFKAVKPLMKSALAYLGPVAIFSHFFDLLFYVFAIVTIILAFVALALHAFFARVEYLILRTAAWFVLPFATLGKTSFIATKGIGYIGSVGLRVLALSLLAAVSAVTLLKYEQYKVDDIVAAFGLSVLSIALLIANIKAPAAAAALINSGPVLDGAMAWQALRAGATEGFKNMSNTVKTGAAAGKAAGGPAGGVSAMVVGVAQQVWNKGTNSYGNSSQNSKSQNQSSSNGAQGQYGPGSYKGGWSSQNRQSSNQASGGSQAASNP